jgi:hypothetical protein
MLLYRLEDLLYEDFTIVAFDCEVPLLADDADSEDRAASSDQGLAESIPTYMTLL